jgi:hypothetical protein
LEIAACDEKVQKMAPNDLKSLDAELKSAPAFRDSKATTKSSVHRRAERPAMRERAASAAALPVRFSLVLRGFGLLGFCTLHSPEVEVEQRLLFVSLILILFAQAQNFLQHLYVETLSLGLGEDFFLALVQRLEFFLDLFDALDEGQNAITRDTSRVGHALPHFDGPKGYDGEGCRRVNDSIEIPD